MSLLKKEELKHIYLANYLKIIDLHMSLFNQKLNKFVQVD